MKKATIFILMALAILKAHAQDYLISFTGAGASATVGAIKVDNLTSGASVTLNGGDVLHLTFTTGTGIPGSGKESLQIYPNPMGNQSTIAFDAPETDDAVISIDDLSGKTICRINNLLSPGYHSFRVSGFSKGVYIVKVSGKNYFYSAKLACQGSLQTEPKIEYLPSTKGMESSQIKSTAATIEMPYTDGERLLYKGTSGIYSTVVTDVPAGNKTTMFTFNPCTDADSNNYSTVQIGTQVWMAENLKTTKYRDGTGIPDVTDNFTWLNLTTGACCDYGNNPSNAGIYGKLYNYYVVEDTRNMCPPGWHVPTMDEWTTLIDYLGGVDVASGKLRESGTTHWASPNAGATNESGFTALPGGFRQGYGTDGNFYYLNDRGYWFSSSYMTATGISLFYNYIFVATNWDIMSWGYSVRCIKD